MEPEIIPDFDILCAGFPCQAFSVCGKQKGFIDDTRGTLFFDIVRILQVKKPKAFILENVKNLTTHDKGKTLSVMMDTLNNLGYTVNYQVLNAKDFGVLQNRERIVLVGNLKGIYFNFEKVVKQEAKPMKEYLDKEGDFDYLENKDYTIIDDKYIKTQKESGLKFVGYRNKPIRKAGVRPNTEHLSRVHRQINRIYSSDGMHPTIASQEKNGRYFIYDNNKVRKLTINECYRFFGFPEDFKKIGNEAQLYERIGNSVCINMIRQVAIEIKNQIKNIKTIVKYEESNKGVYTSLVSSLTYKCLNSKQDIRYHKVELKNGYSGRSFDTKYTTPFLKEKRFLGAMKESGWLTRSIEQAHPFNQDFPGKINHADLKQTFLDIFEDIEEKHVSAREYLIGIFYQSIQEKKNNYNN